MKISRGFLIVLLIFIGGTDLLFSQNCGFIGGTVTFRQRDPWSPPPWLTDSVGIAVMVQRITQGSRIPGVGTAALGPKCCVVPQPCCPKCEDGTLISLGHGVRQFDFGIGDLTPGRYVVFLAVDSCMMRGQGKQILAYAMSDSLGTYSPNQGNVTFARIVEIMESRPVRMNVNIYYSEH